VNNGVHWITRVFLCQRAEAADNEMDALPARTVTGTAVRIPGFADDP